MSAAELRLREEVIDTARRMNALGINRGQSGNVSARCGSGVLVTPSGTLYDMLTPVDIVHVALDGTAVLASVAGGRAGCAR